MTGLVRISASHAFDLLFGGLARRAVQVQDEKFALADVADVAKAQRRQGVLNRLSLRIQDRAFRHYPDMCFHGRHYTKPSAAMPE